MKRLILLATVALAGCGGNGVPVVWTKLASTEAPAECTTADPKWMPLPNRDVKQSELSRNYQTNKEAFKSMRSSRAVCRAGLKAQQEFKG